MLRRRPEICPICGADVRGRIVCQGCGERLPGIAPAPKPTRLLVVTALYIVLGLYRLSAGEPRETIFGIVHFTFGALLLAMLAWPALLRAVQTARAWCGRSGLTDGGLLAPDELVVRGRVRAVLGLRVDDATAAEGHGHDARGGRFVVVGEHGQALVDDDQLHLGPFTYSVRDGDEVEVRGPARRAEGSDGGDYRADVPRWVFDGTPQSPVVVSAVSRR
jgi:hypothetical protein